MQLDENYMREEKIIRVVVDTNIWISFLIGRRLSNLMKLLTRADVQLIFSEELLNELHIVSKRPKFLKYFPSTVQSDRLIDFLRSIGELISLPNVIPNRCRDAKDDYLLELAIRSDADFLITGDDDLLVIKRIEQCYIVTIKEFELYWMGSQDNAILHEP